MTPNPTLQLLGKKIAFSTVVQYAGKGVQLLLSVLTLKLISNFLSEGSYGVYASITEYALLFSTAANLGIFANVVRKMADEPENGKVFINALVLRILTAGGFFVVAIFYLLLGGGDRVFLLGSALFLGSLFFDYITSVCDGMLQANYLMGRATFALVAGKFVHYAVTLSLVQYVLSASDFFAVSLLFAAPLLGALVTAGLSLFFVGKKIKWSFQIDRGFMVKIFLVSLPFGVINIVNNLYFRFLPDLFARNILTDGQFGSFNISFRIAQVLSLFSTFLMFSVLPGFKQYIDEQHWQKAYHLYKRIWQILVVAGTALVLGGSLVSSLAIEFLTAKKYVIPEFGFILPLMLVLAAVSYGYDLILILLFAFEKDYWLLKREFAALGIGLFFFLASGALMDVPTRLGIILSGAIAAESFMVISGIFKIRTVFKKVLAHTVPKQALPE